MKRESIYQKPVTWAGILAFTLGEHHRHCADEEQRVQDFAGVNGLVEPLSLAYFQLVQFFYLQSMLFPLVAAEKRNSAHQWHTLFPHRRSGNRQQKNTSEKGA